jgi:uncharacterized protein (DUF58 family)
VRQFIPASATATQVNLILQTLHETRPGKDTNVAPVCHEIAERIHRRGLVIVISDLFDDPAELLKALAHFRYRRHELVVFHVMADEELTFPFRKWSKFEDLESVIDEQMVDPRSLQAEYLKQIREFLRDVEKGCGQLQADYVPVNTKEPFWVVLSNYFARRQGR